MRDSNCLSTFLARTWQNMKSMYRVLLTFHDLSKNVRNAILTNNSARFKEIDNS